MHSIGIDVAECEFQRFVDLMDIDDSTNESEEAADFQKLKDRLISAMQSGALVINENGEPIYTPQRTKDIDPLTFHEPTGASLMAMDRRKKTEDMAKLYAAMSDMTKTHASTFSKMKMFDLKVCIAVATLFLA